MHNEFLKKVMSDVNDKLDAEVDDEDEDSFVDLTK